MMERVLVSHWVCLNCPKSKSDWRRPRYRERKSLPYVGGYVFALGALFLELLTSEAACDEGAHCAPLHARLTAHLLTTGAALADPAVRFDAATAAGAGLAQLAQRCLDLERNRRCVCSSLIIIVSSRPLESR